MFSWLKRFRKVAPKPVPVILIGIGYASHKLAHALANTQAFKLVACIDEEPWSHKTIFQGAPVKYPSELLALIRKHQVALVVDFRDSPPELENELLEALGEINLRYLCFDPESEPVDHQMKQILNLFPDEISR